MNEINTAHPFLKWPGGKRGIIKHILNLVPQQYQSYHEPFLGGGALFFAIQPLKAVLSDNNPELINCYVQIRDNPDKVIKRLETLRNTEEDYYKIRNNPFSDKVGRAARVIYLVTLSFNGIYRLNNKGEFNVPYGYRPCVNPCNSNKIKAASIALAHANILCADFRNVSKHANEGDLIYFDPPYTVAHGNNGFLKYNAKIFSWQDQVALSEIARDLAHRGCKVIISNAYHPSIVALYPDFQLQVIQRTSVIAASKEFRRQISECIFYNEV